jgi:hypothetical protein
MSWNYSRAYSLYLRHFPLRALAGSLLRSRGIGPVVQLAVMLGLAAPPCAQIAWPLGLDFER